jgi:hypothetical protein
MRKGFNLGAIALLLSLSLFMSGCNTKVIEHENQALKTELGNVKNQLDDTKSQLKKANNDNANLQNTISVLNSATVDESTLQLLAYYLVEQGESSFRSSYTSSTTMFNPQNVDKAKKVIVSQFEHNMAPYAEKDYVDTQVKRLQDAWASKTPITFPDPDKLKQLTLKQKQDTTAVIEAIVTRTSTVSPGNPQKTSSDLLETITMDKNEFGWKLKSVTVEPAPAQPAQAPGQSPANGTQPPQQGINTN